MPNITGYFKVAGQNGGLDFLDGAFYGSAHIPYSVRYQTEEGTGSSVANLDASRSSAIYGASTTVQPPALALIPQIKF